VSPASLNVVVFDLSVAPVGDHRSQFVESEWDPIEPDPVLRVEDGSSKSHQNDKGANNDQRTDKNQK
jgi:hypothetical protein